MLGDIDLNKKVISPNIFLCNPQKISIAKLSEAYGIQYGKTFGNIDTFTFNLPYKVEKRGKVIDNKHIDQIKESYPIKLELNGDIDYFVITDLANSLGNNGIESLNVKANLLPYELTNKIFYQYVSVDKNQNSTPISILEAMTAALSKSPSWSIGDIDDELLQKFRQFNFSQKTALDFILNIATTFNAIIEWDTVNQKISMRNPDNVGENKGLTVSYKKYLQSISDTSSINNLATRMYAYGTSGNSIQSINPTGTEYVESYDFFLFPYMEDSNGNVIQHSDWMSDSLAHALITYENKVASKQGDYSSYLDQQTSLNQQLASGNADLSNLQTQLAIIDDNLSYQKASNIFVYYDFTYNGSTVTESPALSGSTSYAFMMYVSGSTSGLNIKFNGNTTSVNSETWTVLGKVQNLSSVNIEVSGSGSNIPIQIYGVQITADEYANATNTDILENYNDQYEQSLIDSKQSDNNNIQSQLDSVQSNITSLQNSLAIENNFTTDQINEWDQFIIERIFTNSNCVTADELMSAVQTEFDKYKSPPPVIQMSIVNFLEVVEAQRDWNKLVIGDTINIKYEVFGLNIKAKITKIDIDYDNKTIQLTITNIKDILTDEQKFINSVYQSNSTSSEVRSNKDNWTKAKVTYDNFNSYLNNAIDATKQAILAGKNENVKIDNHGLRIMSSKDPENYLIANHAVLAITNDSGRTWSNAITPNGIIGDRLIGKMIIGDNLTMINSSGKFTFDKNGATLDGDSLTITGGINGLVLNPSDGLTITKSGNTARTLLNATDGIKIQSSTDNGSTWNDQFYVNTSGNVVANNMLANNMISYDMIANNATANNMTAKQLKITNGSDQVVIDSNTETIDFSKFTSILGTISYNNALGGTLVLGGSNNQNGILQVDNSNGEVVTNINGAIAGFTTLNAGTVTASNIINANFNDITINVNFDNGDSIQDAIDSIPKYNDGNITINVTGTNTTTTSENILIQSFVGAGSIQIIGSSTNITIDGYVTMRNVNNPITLKQFTINQANNAYSPLNIYNNTYSVVDTVIVYGNNASYGVNIQGSKASVQNSQFYNVTSCIRASYASVVYARDNTGLGSSYGLEADYGSFLGGGGNCPTGTAATQRTIYGGLIQGTFTTNSGAATPPPSPATTTQWKSTGGNNYSNSGFWSNDGVKQGNYGYGRRSGYWFFGTGPSNTVSGKTISKMRIYIERSASGGETSDVGIVLRYHDYTSQPSGAPSPLSESSASTTVQMAWSDKKWVTLPSSFYSTFQSGTAKGIGVYVNSDSHSDYAVMSTSATLEITYQ